LAQTNPAHYERRKPDFERYWFKKFELILDGGKCGPLWLSDETVAKTVAESLHYRDGNVYRLDAFSIMPNHVHIVFKPHPLKQSRTLRPDRTTQALDVPYQSLASIMQSLKGFTAFEANRLLARDGEFWAHESYDHYVRNADEWRRILNYVVNNPVKARYVKNWQEWKWNYRRV
jgi:REP element-mobilizing transposase RayT